MTLFLQKIPLPKAPYILRKPPSSWGNINTDANKGPFIVKLQQVKSCLQHLETEDGGEPKKDAAATGNVYRAQGIGPWCSSAVLGHSTRTRAIPTPGSLKPAGT